MRPSSILVAVAALLFITLPAEAQRQRWPGSESEDQGGTRTAVPRNEPAPREAAPPPPPPAAAQPAPPPQPATAAEPRGGAPAAAQRRAEPRGSRPRGDNPPVGVAVPRQGPPPRRDNPTVYVPQTRVYNNYYYPRRYYPYGYGAFGLGYFYYDPYAWSPGYSGYDYYRFSGYGYGYPTGELRLQVRPRHAEVYVDGYFAGHVDDFDGTFQALRLEEGPYKVEIVAPGYEPLEFDIRIQPGRKITYRGELRPRP